MFTVCVRQDGLAKFVKKELTIVRMLNVKMMEFASQQPMHLNVVVCQQAIPVAFANLLKTHYQSRK